MTGPGRPAIGPKIEVRFPPGLLARLDEHRGDLVSRPSAIRNLVEQALDHLHRPQQSPGRGTGADT